MRSLLSSLQFRLVAGFAVILSAALLSVGWYVSAESGRQAEHSETLRSEVQAERARTALVEHFADRKGWEGAQPAVERLSKLLGARIVVRDANGRLVADSHRRLGPPRLEHAIRDAPLLAGDGTNVGSIDFVSARAFLEGQRLEPLDSDLASRVSQALLWAGLAAGGAGILAVGLIARRTLSPVRALSAAAERLGRGDLAQRVDPSTEDEIGRLGHTFNRMAADLEQAEQQRRGLMADVAHELRTPLSNIRGYVEAMRDGVAERTTPPSKSCTSRSRTSRASSKTCACSRWPKPVRSLCTPSPSVWTPCCNRWRTLSVPAPPRRASLSAANPPRTSRPCRWTGAASSRCCTTW